MDGKNFIAPTNLLLAATATDPNGIRVVNFYSGSIIIGQVTNPPYVLTTNLAAGDYTFSPRAIDNFGARTWSVPARVSVLPFAPRASIKQVDSENVSVTWR